MYIHLFLLTNTIIYPDIPRYISYITLSGTVMFVNFMLNNRYLASTSCFNIHTYIHTHTHTHTHIHRQTDNTHTHTHTHY